MLRSGTLCVDLSFLISKGSPVFAKFLLTLLVVVLFVMMVLLGR